MDKFRMMFQFLQSNQESFMHGICGIMALASAQLYSAFEFNCPCMPEYNYSYGMGIMFAPAVWFFLLGFVLNNNVSILSEEWRRPPGPRGKDSTIFRYMIISVTQRSLIAPVVWISVTLMDGKSFLCAYSMDLDISQFGNVTNHSLSDEEFIRLLAKIPCKQIFDGQHIVSREAATRYIRCVSQAVGWLLLLILTLMAFLVRAMRPCMNQAVFLKTKYWSHYIDIERKMFDEMCTEHAKSFAKVCVHQYFESISEDMRGSAQPHDTTDNRKDTDEDQEKSKDEEDKMLGIHAQEEINRVLWDWHTCKPPLSLKKNEYDSNHVHKVGYDNASFSSDPKVPESNFSKGNSSTNKNGHLNNHANGNGHTRQHRWNKHDHDHLMELRKKQWAAYYSKV